MAVKEVCTVSPLNERQRNRQLLASYHDGPVPLAGNWSQNYSPL